MIPIDLEHERRLTEVESRAQHNSARISDLEKNTEAISKLATSVAVMAERLGNMDYKQDAMVETVDAIAGRLNIIEQRPARRWNKVIEKIIEMIIIAAVGYFLGRGGA